MSIIAEALGTAVSAGVYLPVLFEPISTKAQRHQAKERRSGALDIIQRDQEIIPSSQLKDFGDTYRRLEDEAKELEERKHFPRNINPKTISKARDLNKRSKEFSFDVKTSSDHARANHIPFFSQSKNCKLSLLFSQTSSYESTASSGSSSPYLIVEGTSTNGSEHDSGKEAKQTNSDGEKGKLFALFSQRKSGKGVSKRRRRQSTIEEVTESESEEARARRILVFSPAMPSSDSGTASTSETVQGVEEEADNAVEETHHVDRAAAVSSPDSSAASTSETLQEVEEESDSTVEEPHRVHRATAVSSLDSDAANTSETAQDLEAAENTFFKETRRVYHAISYDSFTLDEGQMRARVAGIA